MDRWDERGRGHIVHTEEFPPGSPQDPKSFEETARAAMAHGEGPVIVCPELERLDRLDALSGAMGPDAGMPG